MEVLKRQKSQFQELHLDALLVSAVVEVEVAGGEVLDGHQPVADTDPTIVECCPSLHYLLGEIFNFKF